ncbi:MAG: FkbM family methyltransferase [Methylophilaceae bacterium]
MTQPPINFQTKTIVNFKNSAKSELELIRAFFDNKSDGFYVDVGANDPVIGSQTYHLEQLGWKGLLIEPLAYLADSLRANRRAAVAQYACSTPENHNKKLQFLMAGVYSTLNKNPIAIGANSSEYIEVTCKTLDSVLDEYGVNPNFDFISIDIEGHEMEMFKGFSFGKWQPALVLLEDHVTNLEKHRHMKKNGYQLLMRTAMNSWYVPRSIGYKLSLYSRLQYFRKYYLGLLPRKLRYMR